MKESAVIHPSLQEKRSLIDPAKVPKHIAFIMDGNRRWAKRNKLPALRGHYQGAENLMKIVKASSLLGVKTLTVYAFSTENWSRSEHEVKAIMALFKLYLTTKKEIMCKEGVRLGSIGDLSRLPKNVQKLFYATKDATKNGHKIELILALNYGARDEIVRAFRRMLEDYEEKKFSKQDLSEELVEKYLDTHGTQDPELLIRTSGELRVSNFLLWQISYSEIYITDVLWPDFTEEHLIDAVLEYQKRERRLGG